MKSIAFYTTPSIWAGEPLEVGKPETIASLTGLMSEVVFSYGSESFTLDVCRDGMLILRIAELEIEAQDSDEFIWVPYMKPLVSWWGRYMDYANCLLLLLDSSVVEVMNSTFMESSEITNKDVMRWSHRGAQSSTRASSSFYYHMARYKGVYDSASPLYDLLVGSRVPVEKTAFDLAAERFLYVCGDRESVGMLSAVAKSLSEYKVGNYRMSIVLAWFVVEATLLRKWERYLDDQNETYEDGSKRINSDRRETLGGRDYPISVITNLLELSGVLEFSLFRDIDKVRDYRNAVVHQKPTYVCEPEHCQLAIRTALGLALEQQPFTIAPNLNFSIVGN